MQDVNETVSAALAAKSRLDAGRVAVFGGSHGGLLAAHLSAQFPERYRVSIMRNPVYVGFWW